MASKQHLQERIDKWNIKINGYKEKIAKYEERLAKRLKLLSKSVGEDVTVDTYENYGRVDFENYMRVSNALDGIETNERNIRWTEREIRDIQYKLDEILKKEKEFDYDLETILQDKLSEFKAQWIARMNAYYTKLWHSMRKNAEKAKILLAELEEERRTLSHREYYRWKELDNKISDCRKVIHHESMKYDTPEAYVDSMQEDIINYFNDAIKRLVVKCYKFNIDRNNLEVSYPEVTEKGMECFIKDLTNNKVIWARMIWAAEYSDYMVPHVRYIVTERKKIIYKMKNPYIQQLKLNENETNRNFYLDRISLNEEAGTPLFNEVSVLFNSLDIANNLLKRARIINRDSKDVKFLDETFTINYNEKIINTNATELGLNKIIKSNKQLKICVKCVKGNTLPIVILNLLSTGVNRTSTLDKITDSGFFMVNPISNMEINCFAINNKIVPISFFRVIVHEFNHFFESYKRSIKNLNVDFILKNKNIKNIQNDINNDISLRKQEKDALNNIIYTLFSYGELNAFVSSLFGELVSYNVTDKKEFNSIWKELDSFYRYNRLKDDLNVISYIDSDILYKLCKNLTNIKTVSPIAFKNMFLKRCTIKLQKYYNKMMKLVDRYIYRVSDLNQYGVNFYITSD